MQSPTVEQPTAREGRVGPGGKSERPILPKKPGNAGGGKGPWFKSNERRSKGPEIGASLQTPKRVWQLQEALDAQAKSERLVCESMNPLERKPDALCGVGNYVAQRLKNPAFIGVWTPPTPHNILASDQCKKTHHAFLRSFWFAGLEQRSFAAS